jgi:hypothetical protein
VDATAGKAAAGQLEPLLLGPAGPAPGRPEVQHQRPVAEAGQVQPPPVDRLAGEGRQRPAILDRDDGDVGCHRLDLAGAPLRGQTGAAGAGQHDHDGDRGHGGPAGQDGDGAACHGDLGLLDDWTDQSFECIGADASGADP